MARDVLDPMRDLINLQERVNRLFEGFAHQGRGAGADLERGEWTPAADVYEQDDAFLVLLDIPGVRREALEVDLNEDRLTVRGERTADRTKARRAERPIGRFVRSFALPPTVDRAGIVAEYRDGVLALRLPKQKKPESQRMRIEIK